LGLNTTSAVITFYEQLEEKAARLYERLADKCPEGRGSFLALAGEARKDRKTVLRAYREAITDAFETGFSFTGLNEDDYKINTELPENMSYSDTVKRALEMEEKIHRFCTDVSQRSKELQADISNTFERAAKRKTERKLILQSILER